jgi:hypothetical protein
MGRTRRSELGAVYTVHVRFHVRIAVRLRVRSPAYGGLQLNLGSIFPEMRLQTVVHRVMRKKYRQTRANQKST